MNCPACELVIDVLDQCPDCIRENSEAMVARRRTRSRLPDPTKCMYGHPRHRDGNRWRCKTCNRICKAAKKERDST